ncbi:hypothetical protein NLI96_g12466 [Meripilus lineatus]|uniref:C2H2-type domain-containing protein n=1 Tax=Meripilus lineatus TaxID=2056292 RepID=A0AAD5UQ16_9APHY|nr:hypothetical protein NLI96_g12466 [Physisporinus lineatus]
MPREASTNTCPSCHRVFKGNGSLQSHIKQAARCQWLLKTRNAVVAAPDLPLGGPLEQNPSPPTSSTSSDCDEDIPMPQFESLPPPLPSSPAPVPQSTSRTPRMNPQQPQPPTPQQPQVPTRSKAPVVDAAQVVRHPTAGKVYARSKTKTQEREAISKSTNPFAPFTNRLDWEIAKWAKETKTGDNKLNGLLEIKGVVESLGLSYPNARALNQIIDHELPTIAEWSAVPIQLDNNGTSYELFKRDIMKCIRVLYGNPTFADVMSYAPEKHFAKMGMVQRMFSEMHVCDWWNDIQNELPPGATVIPVIFATDKTQVSQFSGTNTMYPLYMTIGNIDKATRRKPSRHAWILVAYLPTPIFDNLDLTDLETRVARARLFHSCMTEVVQPLIRAGSVGEKMVGGDGDIRHCHPILATYVADHPEHCLVTCSRTGVVCPSCGMTICEFGDHTCNSPRKPKDALEQLNLAAEMRSLNQADEALKAHGLTCVFEPFWKDLPHCNIYQSVTPDILHQGYQGVLKHLVGWLRTIVGDTEIDARFKRLPFMHGVRSFDEGISGLSRVSGGEHKQICKQLLGCIVGKAPAAAIRATVALLEFFYLAQYHSHTDETLQYMTEALDKFHANKQVFIDTGARDVEGDHFNFPKLHFLEHYVPLIRLFGTTDNYNTEATERLHIELVKDAYRATNHKDYVEQMIRWLSRREKVNVFDARTNWILDKDNPKKKPKPKAVSDQPIQLASQPSVKNVSMSFLAHEHGAERFLPAMRTFIARYGDPARTGYAARATDRYTAVPFGTVNVWHRMKFNSPSVQSSNAPDTNDILDAYPKRYNKKKKKHDDPRFDTVFVNDDNAEETGIKGSPYLIMSLNDID